MRYEARLDRRIVLPIIHYTLIRSEVVISFLLTVVSNITEYTLLHISQIVVVSNSYVHALFGLMSGDD